MRRTLGSFETALTLSGDSNLAEGPQLTAQARLVGGEPLLDAG